MLSVTMNPLETRTRKLLVMIPSAHASALIALVLRTLWAMGIPNSPVADCFIYDLGARNILSGFGFSFHDGNPNGVWAPGYSYLVALFYGAFEPAYWAAYLANIMMAVALVYTTRMLGERLHSKWAGRIAAFGIAVYPTFVMYSTVIASDHLYILQISLFLLWALPLARAQWQWQRCVALGLLLGTCILVRASAYVLPVVVLAVGPLYARRSGNKALNTLRHGLPHTALIVAIGLLVCVPQGLRNLEHFGEFNFSSLSSGSLLWRGNHDGPDEGQVTPWGAPAQVQANERQLRKTALAFIRDNPGLYLKRVFLRSFEALRAETIAMHWNEPGLRRRFGPESLRMFKLVGSLGYWAMGLCFAGLLLLRITQRSLGPSDFVLLLMLGLHLLPILLFSGQNRYHLPMVPFVLLYVGMAASSRFNQRRLQRSDRPLALELS